MTRFTGVDHMNECLREAAELSRKLLELPTRNKWPRLDYDRAIEELMRDLSTRLTARATVRQSSSGSSISMLGVRSTSTVGFESACRNWIVQVSKMAGKFRASRDIEAQR